MNQVNEGLLGRNIASFRGLALLIATICLITSFRVQAQTAFPTPTAAADALIEAIALNDDGALARVLGKAWHSVLPLEQIEPEKRYEFLARSHESRQVQQQGKRATILVGKDAWELPIPLQANANGQWQFDLAAAQEEIRSRIIGANELAAMKAMLAYVDAQREYASADRDGNGVLEYAQRLRSSPGKRNGLIWSASLGDASPLGEAFLPSKKGEGYFGYHYRILTGQGPSAPGGARSYLIGKRMVSGFALIAWPVRYGETGVMSFIVNQRAQIYEADLGPATSSRVAAIKLFEPSAGWRPAKP